MKRRRLSLEEYVDGVLAGDRMILSRAITLVESQRDDDRQLAGELIQRILPATGKSFRIGITGVPGVGKSTFIDSFGSYLINQGHRVAVLAVDPSSSISKGSILGDKTRMARLSHHEMAYIRPSPTGGSLGGVARKTRESLLLCEAAGYDMMLIETVGVGQSEIAVQGMVDAFLLLMLPHAGDELQGIKKGIMEMADLLVINKADGEMMKKARTARAVYSQALRLFPASPSGWKPPVLLCSAWEETGISKIYESLLAFRERQQEADQWQKKRSDQVARWMQERISDLLHHRFYHHPEVEARFPALVEEVRKGQIGPMQAAEALVALFTSAAGSK